ncbi:unnamed protein product [Schistocephalus solidus]|uniref:Transposase n=1 Tax=Schistocephalus solidus TaxID=70667 RepID=A0A183TRM0_SCHSO|nr:unnamed protein product [Schistocephalus solidus]
MFLSPPLTGKQISHVDRQSWVLPSGNSPGNLHERRAKPAGHGSQIAKYAVVKLKRVTKPPAQSHVPYPPGRSDNPRRNWPEWRMALVTRVLARYKVDIAALNDTRFSDQGQLEEAGAGYTFFCSGRSKAE